MSITRDSSKRTCGKRIGILSYPVAPDLFPSLAFVPFRNVRAAAWLADRRAGAIPTLFSNALPLVNKDHRGEGGSKVMLGHFWAVCFLELHC